jgi:hypothetical protein
MAEFEPKVEPKKACGRSAGICILAFEASREGIGAWIEDAGEAAVRTASGCIAAGRQLVAP